MSLILYFLRHGETEESLRGGFCGSLDSPLTSDGRLMAEDFALTYAALPWIAVYSSPLKRAQDTAKPLCAAIGMRMQIRDGLREIAVLYEDVFKEKSILNPVICSFKHRGCHDEQCQ